MIQYKTILMSADFALDCVEGNSSQLIRLFPDMNEGTAQAVLANRGRIKVAASTIEVPTDLIVH